MKTKICTSIEQSRELIELGLDPKTADLYYKYVMPNSDKIMHNPEIGNPINALEWYNKGYTFSGKKALTIEKFCIPAWSLTSLLKIIKDYTMQTTTTGKVFIVCSFNEHPWSLVSQAYDNEVDACFNLVCSLIQGGHIKTEKK